MLEHPTDSHSSAKLATGSSRGLAEQLAILAITHRPHFIEIADRVYELHQGRVDRIDDVKIPATRVT
jgi:ABC-type multidrug transport system fused ATPase/permease subunit